jgi:Mg-chelatase subunit ChlI
MDRERSLKEAFPLTAVVGHQDAKRAIILALINPGLNLLLWGDEGLGKRTMVMGASRFLPKIKTTGCVFNCDPKNRAMQCTKCLKGGWRALEKDAPFVVLPYHVKEDKLFGTEDGPESSFVGRANRGILAIRNMENHDRALMESLFSRLKRRKISLGEFEYPAFIQIMATYNGNPGKVAENFALKVRVKEIEDIEERIEIVRRSGEFRKNPIDFIEAYAQEEEKLRKRIEYSRESLRRVAVPSKIGDEVRKIVKDYGLREEYGRWIIIAATANAAYEERLSVRKDDIGEVMPFIIPFNP